MELVATVPWLELRRCLGCGLLHEHPDRGARRVGLAHVRAAYPEAPPIPRHAPLPSDPDPV